MQKSDRKNGRRCLKCGKTYRTDVIRCPYCGGRLETDAKEDKNRRYLEG